MALAPEFFVLLGVSIFVALSIISFLLEHHVSSILQYLFQGAAGVGLAEILLSQGLTDTTRVWAGIVYLACALSSLVGVNIRLAVFRRSMNVASIFSQMMTLPAIMVSALFLSSFLENGGELVFAPASIVTITVAVLVANLSVFGLLREYSRHGNIRTNGLIPFQISPSPTSTQDVARGLDLGPLSEQEFALHQHPEQREEWEESPTKEND